MYIRKYLQRTTRVALVIIVMINSDACTNRHTEIYSNKTEAIPAITLHGEFCGPNHPNVDTGSKFENLMVLAKIKPRDNLDEACQRHDICYELFGFGDRECDKSLAYDVMSINFPKTNQEAHCEIVKSTIGQLYPISTNIKSSSYTLGDLFYATGLSYLFVGTFGIVSSIDENILFNVDKLLTIANTQGANLNRQTITSIINYETYCNEQNTKISGNFTYYHLYFLDTLVNGLFLGNYLSKSDFSKLRSYYLSEQLSQIDYSMLWNTKGKILGPGQIKNPVIFKSWPVK